MPFLNGTRAYNLIFRHSSVASTYALLAGSSFLHITQSTVRKKLNEEQLKELLLDFLENSQNLEKNARAGVPMVSKDIQDKIIRRQMKFDSLQNQNSHNFRVQVSPNKNIDENNATPTEMANNL